MIRAKNGLLLAPDPLVWLADICVRICIIVALVAIESWCVRNSCSVARYSLLAALRVPGAGSHCCSNSSSNSAPLALARSYAHDFAHRVNTRTIRTAKKFARGPANPLAFALDPLGPSLAGACKRCARSQHSGRNCSATVATGARIHKRSEWPAASNSAQGRH